MKDHDDTQSFTTTRNEEVQIISTQRMLQVEAKKGKMVSSMQKALKWKEMMNSQTGRRSVYVGNKECKQEEINYKKGDVLSTEIVRVPFQVGQRTL